MFQPFLLHVCMSDMFVPTLFYVAEHRGRAVFWHSSDMYTSYPLWPGHHNKGAALTRSWLCPRTLWSWELGQIDRFRKYVIEIYNKFMIEILNFSVYCKIKYKFMQLIQVNHFLKVLYYSNCTCSVNLLQYKWYLVWKCTFYHVELTCVYVFIQCDTRYALGREVS